MMATAKVILNPGDSPIEVNANLTAEAVIRSLLPPDMFQSVLFCGPKKLMPADRLKDVPRFGPGCVFKVRKVTLKPLTSRKDMRDMKEVEEVRGRDPKVLQILADFVLRPEKLTTWLNRNYPEFCEDLSIYNVLTDVFLLRTLFIKENESTWQYLQAHPSVMTVAHRLLNELLMVKIRVHGRSDEIMLKDGYCTAETMLVHLVRLQEVESYDIFCEGRKLDRQEKLVYMYGFNEDSVFVVRRNNIHLLAAIAERVKDAEIRRDLGRFLRLHRHEEWLQSYPKWRDDADAISLLNEPTLIMVLQNRNDENTYLAKNPDLIIMLDRLIRTIENDLKRKKREFKRLTAVALGTNTPGEITVAMVVDVLEPPVKPRHPKPAGIAEHLLTLLLAIGGLMIAFVLMASNTALDIAIALNPRPRKLTKEYDAEIKTLQDLGFDDDDVSIAALVACNGNIRQAVAFMRAVREQIM